MRILSYCVFCSALLIWWGCQPRKSKSVETCDCKKLQGIIARLTARIAQNQHDESLQRSAQTLQKRIESLVQKIESDSTDNCESNKFFYTRNWRALQDMQKHAQELEVVHSTYGDIEKEIGKIMASLCNIWKTYAEKYCPPDFSDGKACQQTTDLLKEKNAMFESFAKIHQWLFQIKYNIKPGRSTTTNFSQIPKP